MVDKKRAFTLVESIISMMIIMVVAVGAMTSLTKKKPQIESVTLRGQYACWIDDGTYGNTGKLLEWYFDERSPRTARPIVVDESVGCKLKLDQRPANFYILAAGAGNLDTPGQVSTVYTPAIGNELDVVIGKANILTENVLDSRTTKVLNGEQAVAIANGPSASGSVISGLIPANVKSCKLISGDACAKSCEVVAISSYSALDGTYFNDYKIRINGCEDIDIYGNPTMKLIKFDSLTYSGISGTMDFDNVNPSDTLINTIAMANPDGYYSGVYKLGFDFYNSSYLSPKRLLNFTNNTNNNYSTQTRSKMTKILENISIRRKSELTDLLIKLNAGAPAKNGAVLILW